MVHIILHSFSPPSFNQLSVLDPLNWYSYRAIAPCQILNPNRSVLDKKAFLPSLTFSVMDFKVLVQTIS